MGTDPKNDRATGQAPFVKRYAFEPKPGEIGMGPDELQAIGEIEEPVTSGAYHELMGVIVKLKARRIAMGLSLTDVSDRSGINRQAVSTLENGRTMNPTIDTLWRYSLALDAGITFGIAEVDPETGEMIDR